jgi:hypothetical protein
VEGSRGSVLRSPRPQGAIQLGNSKVVVPGPTVINVPRHQFSQATGETTRRAAKKRQ